MPFNTPPRTGKEHGHVLEALNSPCLSGNSHYGRLCEHWFQTNLPCKRAMLVTSCTHALEMAAILLEIQAGDEVIVPSFTFVSTANAFVLRGAKIVFAEICPTTMNIDINKIESLITSKTKAIVPVHYAGTSCDMPVLMRIARSHNVAVVEDAAQCIDSKYLDKQLGTYGDLATFSFHETKNITAGGEGGMLIINDNRYLDRAEIIRDKGTNRKQFSDGVVDKYTWIGIGSSYLLGEMNAAYLYSQLQNLAHITQDRLRCWDQYFDCLSKLQSKGVLQLPLIPSNCVHNGHIFHIRTDDLESRNALIEYLRGRGVLSVFHYIPLHSSPMGIKVAGRNSKLEITTREAQRLIRLPMYYGLETEKITFITDCIYDYFK